MRKLNDYLAFGAALLIGACDAATPDTPTTDAGDTGDDGLESSTGVAVVSMGAFPEARLVEVTFAPGQRAFAWRWAAQAGDVVRLATNGVTPADLDTVLKVYPSLPARTSATPMARNDDCDARTRDACLTLTAPNTQDYFVVVHRKDLGTSGTAQVIAPSDEPLVVPVTIDGEGLQHSDSWYDFDWRDRDYGFAYSQIHQCHFDETVYLPSVYPKGLVFEARFPSGVVFVKETTRRYRSYMGDASVLFELVTSSGEQDFSTRLEGSAVLMDDAVHGFFHAPPTEYGYQEDLKNPPGVMTGLKLQGVEAGWLLESLRIGLPASSQPLRLVPHLCSVEFSRRYWHHESSSAEALPIHTRSHLMRCTDYDTGPFRVRPAHGSWPLAPADRCFAPLVAPEGTRWIDIFMTPTGSVSFSDAHGWSPSSVTWLEERVGAAPPSMCPHGGEVFFGGWDDGAPTEMIDGVLFPTEWDGFRVACDP